MAEEILKAVEGNAIQAALEVAARVAEQQRQRHHALSLEAIEIIRRMAGRFPDDQIATTLNRLALRTGPGNTWNEGRIRSVRSYHQWPAYDASSSRNSLTLEEASERLGVSHKVVRRLIEAKKILGTQVVPCAPWEISAESIESEEVLREVENLKRRVRIERTLPEPELPMFAEL